jgi:hypothetical protein
MANQGEGSRGGKIIGHTKSGRPIYAGSRDDHTTRNKIIKSAGFVGAGAGVGVYTGGKAAKLVKEAGHQAMVGNQYARQYKKAVQAGEKLGPLFSQGSQLSYLKKQSESFKESSKSFSKAGFRLKTLGGLVAGTLIGIGVNEAIKDRPEVQESKKAQALAIAAPGALGAIATGTGFYKALGRNKVSWKGAAKFAIRNLLVFK